MTPIRVLLVDDHAVLREGLAMLIAAQADMTVVGEAGTAEEAIARAKEVEVDVVVIDISLPGLSGVETIAKLGELCPRVKALVLSMHEDTTYVRAALAAGAWGYVPKHAAATRLLAGIREVSAGRSFINVSMGQHELRDLLDVTARESRGGRGLTDREQEVLALWAEGYSNSQIGAKLGISKKSVDTYRARIGEKLGLKHRAEIVRYALETGVLRASCGGD